MTASADSTVFVIELGLEYAVSVAPDPEPVVIVMSDQGPPGPPGRDSPDADGPPVISTNPDNRIRRGTDGGLHVLDKLSPDPLAYYILARS